MHPEGMSGIGRFGARAWDDLAGDPAELELVDATEPPVSLPSRLDVTGMAGDSVALAILATHRVIHARGLTSTTPRVRVRGDRLVTSIQSERHARVGGQPLDAWAPLSGFWPARDGWVRTHGNYPHHAERLRAILGLDVGAGKDDVAAAIHGLGAQELEDAAAERGAIAVRVRTPEQWQAHPQARAVETLPLLATHRVDDAPPRPWTASASTPLEGVRVLDLTRVIAGPVATRDLASAGADVLRVDSPHLPEIEWQHLDTGQGKRSALLDLAGRAAFDELIAGADVVVTGYRPGSLERLGLSPDALLRQYPGLIVATVSAWGDTGPWGQRRGFDSIVQAASGIAMIESDDGETPGALPAQALDHSAGHLLAAGIIHALHAQRRDGGGRTVSVALARVAHELIAEGVAPEKRPQSHAAPTVQVGPDGSAFAAPVLTFEGAPAKYAQLARPWGRDDPRWLNRPPNS